jgi:hypothetical protein
MILAQGVLLKVTNKLQMRNMHLTCGSWLAPTVHPGLVATNALATKTAAYQPSGQDVAAY